MNQLTREKRAQVIGCLVEGCSLRSTVRLTGVAKKTVSRLLVEIGTACKDYQDRTLRNLACRRVQVDEVWSFIYAKQKNVTEKMKEKPGVGDVWTWTAIDAESKLILSYHVGNRDGRDAYFFMQDVASRLANRIQLTSDGHSAYLQAVEDAFGAGIDYAMLVKLYGNEVAPSEARYSPAICIGARKRTVQGSPDKKHISTSFSERSNLTLRMSSRRFTRLTNAFSKKFENHCHAVALFTMHYNFARIHQTLRVTPAMQAGVCDHLWSLEEIAGLLD